MAHAVHLAQPERMGAKGEATRFGVAGLGEIDRIAHRIVHGGRTFDGGVVRRPFVISFF